MRLGSAGPSDAGGLSVAEQRYGQLRARLTPVETGAEVYSIIDEYLEKSHAKLHSGQVARATRAGAAAATAAFATVIFGGFRGN